MDAVTTTTTRHGLPALADDQALFLDIDGTLVELAPRPGDIDVPAALLDTLTRLHAHLGGAAMLVTGRALADVDVLFAPLRLPAAGVHGAEWRRIVDGPIEQRFDGAADLRPVVAAFEAFAAADPGLIVEDKAAAVTLHYRAAPAYGAAARAVAEAAAAGAGVELLAGKMMFEIKLRATTKGTIVDEIMRDPLFAGRQPLFVGDDVTDEAGFAAVNARGGISVRVGPPPPGIARTFAHWQCDGVAAVRRWLDDFATTAE